MPNLFRLNAKKPKQNAGLATPKDEIYLLYVEDIIEMPSPNDKGILVIGDIKIKDNRFFHTLYLTPSSQIHNRNSEGNVDSRGWKKKITGNFPGDELEINEFVKNNINQGFVAVVKSCSSEYKKIYGSKNNPLYFTGSFKDDNESKGYELTFEQNFADEFPVLFYQGKIILDRDITNSEFIHNNYETELNKIKESLDSVLETVNNIQIGGRNLIKESLKTIDYSTPRDTYYIDGLVLSQDIEPSTVYTFSFDYEIFQEYTAKLWFHHPLLSFAKSLTGKKGRFSFTVNSASSISDDRYLRIYNYGYQATNEQMLNNGFIISNFKLEKGFKDTGWTPAPEDLLREDFFKTLPNVNGNLAYTKILVMDNYGNMGWVNK